jgi:hypothetical protein
MGSSFKQLTRSDRAAGEVVLGLSEAERALGLA